MAISKAKQIAELVKGVNATLKARANAGKVQQMTKDSVIPKDINGFFDDAVGKKFPTVEDDFVTTASKMSFAKSGLNASLYNKRRLQNAVENWNRNKKYTYYRGENTQSSPYKPKDLSSPEGKRYLEANENVLKSMVNSGFNRGIRGGRKPVDKYKREFRDAFFSNRPEIADAYARSDKLGIPIIKKIQLNKEQIQRGMERNFESNTAAGQEDIILDLQLLDKATRSFWRGIARKFQKYNKGGLATVLKI
jgi:Ni/Co efflux regulator RcnB